MEPPARRLVRLVRRTRWTGSAVPVTAGLVLAAGFLAILPGLPAVGVAVGLAAALGTWRLVRLALAIHASRHTYGPCRGAGFLGMGVLAAGLTSAALPLLRYSPAGGGARPVVAAAGMVVATVMYLLGLLLLPGAAPTPAARLRRGLDGLSIAASLAFVGTALLPPVRLMPPTAVVAELTLIGGLSIVVVTAVRAVRYRRAALLCAGGAAAGLVGLAALALLLAYGGPPVALLVAAVPLVAGPELAWAGARRVGAGPKADALVDLTGEGAGYPLLAVPVSLAVLTAGYRVLTTGGLDQVSISLALVMGTLLAVREVLAAGDIRRYARRMARHEAHFRSLVAGAGDLILVLDEDLVVRWQSPAAARLFGLSDADVVGHPFVALLHVDDIGPASRLLAAVLASTARPEGTADADGTGHPLLLCARLRDGFGRWRDTESTISDQRDVPEVAALVLHVRDVGERRELERAVRQLASTDQVTGLPNRRELLRTLVGRRDAGNHPGVLLAIDVDGVSTVNNTRGREVGDAVLAEVGRRLRIAMGPDDLPGSLGGDEFAVVTPAGQVVAYALGARLLVELTRPYELPGVVVRLRVCVGLAELGAGDSVDDVLERADRARRRARQLGGNRVEWYDARLDAQIDRRMDIERELASAIERNQLDLVFQPVVSLLDRRPVGVEALLRWRHPVLGTVAPAEVIPVAEEQDIIGEIGDWVLNAACRHVASWLATGNDVWISVNVSPHELAAPDFLARVEAALLSHGLPPRRLVLEVAEARLGAHLGRLTGQLAALRALGVRIALDDFGTGSAALPQLRRLPLDLVKVDFGAPLAQDRPLRPDVAPPTGTAARRLRPGGSGAAPDVEAVVELARDLELDLVAEGLESRTRLDDALTAGCRLGQGLLLGPPVPAERIEAYLEDHRAPSL